MRRSLSNLSLRALRAFESAARVESFKAAAAELGISPAAVSQQIKLLETQLGAPLFDRLHRRLRLTNTGARLGKALQLAFAEIDQTLATLTDNGLVATSSTLTVTAAPTFATKWLAPRLHRFQQRNSAVEIRLRAEEILSDPGLDPGVDIALRYGAGPYSGKLRSQKLWRAGELRAVCAPELGQVLSHPVEMLSHPLLRTAAPNGKTDEALAGWTSWFAAAGVDGCKVREAVTRAAFMGTSGLALEVAASGRGIALAPAILVEADLRGGRLVEPFPFRVEDPFSFWLLHRRDREQEKSIRSFASWILTEAQDVILPQSESRFA